MRTLKTKEYYDSIAEGYNELYREEQFEKFEKIPKLKGKTLDLGAGTGLLNQFVDVHVSADLSSKILTLNKNENKVCCTITHLPFKDNTFDNTISITVMQDLNKTEIKKAIKEINRVSKKKKIISIMGSSAKLNFFQEILARQYNADFIESGRDLLAIFE